MEGLIPFTYRAVVRDRSRQICRRNSSRKNLLFSPASSSGRSSGSDHVLPNGESCGRFDNIAPQGFQLTTADPHQYSSQSLLHRRAVSSCLFKNGDERSSAGKQATGVNFPAEFPVHPRLMARGLKKTRTAGSNGYNFYFFIFIIMMSSCHMSTQIQIPNPKAEIIFYPPISCLQK